MTKMRLFFLLLSSSFVFVHSLIEINGRNVTHKLVVSNAYHDAGKWGEEEICPLGSFVTAINIRYQSGGLDETAIEMVKLYCASEINPDSGSVTSAKGSDGSDQGRFNCTIGYAKGFRAKVLEYQGLFTDDVAIHDIEFSCGGAGEQIIDGIPSQPKYNKGDWSDWDVCVTGNSICGLQTRYDGGIADDKTGVCDIKLFCCPENEA